MYHRANGHRAIVLALAAMLVPASAFAQQARPYIGFGYVIDAPELYMGGAVYAVTPDVLGGLGLYVDAKFPTEYRDEVFNFEPDITVDQVVNEFGDQFQRDDEDWYNVNAAVMRPLTPGLTAYLGAGYASVKRYHLYQIQEGDTEARGLGGIYWVEAVDEAETLVNILGGVFVSISDNINAQFGAERHPRGVTVGLSYRLNL